MIIEILELAAALEWIALGVLVFSKLRGTEKRTRQEKEELDELIAKLSAEDENPLWKLTPNQLRAAYGLEPIDRGEFTARQEQATEDTVR